MIEASAAPADLGQELEEVALNLPAIQLEGVVAIRSRFGVVAVQRPVASACHPTKVFGRRVCCLPHLHCIRVTQKSLPTLF